MINTVNTKEQQLKNGYFKIDCGDETILIIGSCRSVPYVEYFHQWNLKNDNRFTIAFIDPFNFNYDLNDNRIDSEAKINSLETDWGILSLLQSTKIFIHEFYSNFGMFNTDKKSGKSIYDFGLSPEVDICIPNFNNFFILFSDIVSFDLDMRRMAISDYNVLGRLSPQTVTNIREIGLMGITKFYQVCAKSDLPEMHQYFENNFRDFRLFWTHNHVSKLFTLQVFSLINSKFLNLYFSTEFWTGLIKGEDMFANNYTYLTEYDDEVFKYKWPEERVSLRSKLF